jgi:hypothetical protein
MYKPPYTVDQIRKKYSKELAEKLINDSIHGWRARTGIELIHKEPTPKEQERIWKNWQQMTDEQKKISDEKSIELFGKTNEEHKRRIMSKGGE